MSNLYIPDKIVASMPEKENNRFDFLGPLSGIANSVYNLFTNKRDFDYQKSLQQQIFEREDTAVQRRMADLQAAGLNPNLAAGSSAGAGAVVGRSTTNDVNLGSFLDNAMAMQQIKSQKHQTDILRNQATQSYWNAQSAKVDYHVKSWEDLWNTMYNEWLKGSYDYLGESSKSPYIKMLDYELQNMKNSADLLQKQNNWYTTNQVVDMLTGGIGAVTGAVNAGANVKKANSMLRR